MSTRTDTTDEALTLDAAAQVAASFPLTETGKSYARRWAAYVLRVDRAVRAEGAAKARHNPRVKRPRCAFNHVVGRQIRQAVTDELDGQLQARDLKPLHGDTRTVAVP